MKTPTMLAMPPMTSSQPTMIVVTRVASIALYSATSPRMNSTTPSAMNQPRPLPVSVSGGDAMVMLQWTSSVLPLPAARAAATSEYAPRARRDSTLATPASPRRFMRMGRRRVVDSWPYADRRIHRTGRRALASEPAATTLALASALAAHWPSGAAARRHGEQTPSCSSSWGMCSRIGCGCDLAWRCLSIVAALALVAGRRLGWLLGDGILGADLAGRDRAVVVRARPTTSRWRSWRSVRPSSRPPDMRATYVGPGRDDDR